MNLKPNVDAVSEGRAQSELMAQTHYENFPVGSRWIRSDLRPHVHAIYAFARTADDFADEAQFEGERLERLQAWREGLEGAVQKKPGSPVFQALSQTIHEKDIPVEWLDQLIQAFELDVKKNRHPDFASIESYARFSANPVGRLVLWLHGYRDENLFELSDAFCSGLQFANFWQDVAVDWKKNRIYLPQNDMKRFGYSEEDLNRQVVDDRFRRLLQMQIDRTWLLFFRARRLCDLVGKDLRMELRLTWLGGTKILEKLVQNEYDVFQRRPKIQGKDKALLLWRALTWRKG